MESVGLYDLPFGFSFKIYIRKLEDSVNSVIFEHQ